MTAAICVVCDQPAGADVVSTRGGVRHPQCSPFGVAVETPLASALPASADVHPLDRATLRAARPEVVVEPKRPRLVLIESPLRGAVRRNRAYTLAAMRDSLARGEAPFASHLLYAQDGVLDDDKPEEREQGIDAGLAWGARAEATVAYVDLGVSDGMRRGIEDAQRAGRPVEYRTVPGWRWPSRSR